MTDRVSDELLDTYISQRFHWKTLLPHQVYAMAVELKRRREGSMADNNHHHQNYGSSAKQDTERLSEYDNPDQERFPRPRRNYLCSECHYAGGDHHPHCPNS